MNCSSVKPCSFWLKLILCNVSPIYHITPHIILFIITVRLQNAEGVPPDNSQRHSLEQEITLALILKSHSKSAAQIFKKLDRWFPHGAGRLDSNWLEDEASAQFGVLGDFPDFSGVSDGSSGERGSYQVRWCKRVDTRSVPDETAATWVRVHCYSIWSLSVAAVKTRRFEHGRYPSCRKATSNDVV